VAYHGQFGKIRKEGSCFRTIPKTASGSSTPGTGREEAEKIAGRMIEMGYLKFVPTDEWSTLREQIVTNLEKYGRFECEILEDLGNGSLHWPDRRRYNADNEDLMDGMIGSHITDLQTTLSLEGVIATQIKDEVDEQGYIVRVNGRPHIIYQWGDKHGEVNTWGLAHRGFMEIVNTLLDEVGSPERLYGISSGNDGGVLLLTNEMFDYLQAHRGLFSIEALPYRVEDTLARW
jgi:hypothetical protein